jgi:hypothetical protein
MPTLLDAGQAEKYGKTTSVVARAPLVWAINEADRAAQAHVCKRVDGVARRQQEQRRADATWGSGTCTSPERLKCMKEISHRNVGRVLRDWCGS